MINAINYCSLVPFAALPRAIDLHSTHQPEVAFTLNQHRFKSLLRSS